MKLNNQILYQQADGVKAQASKKMNEFNMVSANQSNMSAAQFNNYLISQQHNIES